MRLRLAALAGVLLFAAGCDTDDVPDFDPDTVDFDQVTSLSYQEWVRPLLAARDLLSPTATTGRGDPQDYDWDALFDGPFGEYIVPFDANGSLLVRFVEDLPADAALPIPNVRRLQDDEVRFLKRWIEAGARDDSGEIPYADSRHLIYVCVQGENRVAIIDAEKLRVIRNVYLGDHGHGGFARGPHAVAFSDDGDAWFVSIIDGHRILKLSTDLEMDPSAASYFLGASPATFTTPGLIDLHEDLMIVGRSTFSTSNTFGIGRFDPATLQFEEFGTLPGFDIPHGIALTVDGTYLIAASMTQGKVAVFDPLTGDAVDELTVSGSPELIHLSVLPDQRTITLTDGANDRVLFFEISSGGQLTPAGEVAVGDRPWHAHLDHDGRTLLVPNRAGNSLTLVDVPTRAVVRTVTNTAASAPFAQPHSPASSEDGRYVFVSNSNATGAYTPRFPFRDETGQPLPNSAQGNLTVVERATGAIAKVIDLGAFPSGVEHHAHGHSHGGGLVAGGSGG